MKTKRHAHVVSVGIVIVFVSFVFLPHLNFKQGRASSSDCLQDLHSNLSISKHCNSAALHLLFCVFFVLLVLGGGHAGEEVSECALSSSSSTIGTVLALGVTQREGETESRPCWSSNFTPFPPPSTSRPASTPHETRRWLFDFTLNPFDMFVYLLADCWFSCCQEVVEALEYDLQISSSYLSE